MPDASTSTASLSASMPLIVAQPAPPPLYCVFIDVEDNAVHLAPAADCHIYWVRGATHIQCMGRHYQTKNGAQYDLMPTALERYRTLVEGAASQPRIEGFA